MVVRFAARYLIPTLLLVVADASFEHAAVDDMRSEDGSSFLDAEEELIQECRRDPSWNSHLFESCSKATGWDRFTRNDYWWKSVENTWLQDGKDQAIRNCLNNTLSSKSWGTTCNNTDWKDELCEIREPTVSGWYESFEHGALVTIDSVLSEYEAFAVESLAQCIGEVMSKEMPFYQERPFGDDEESETYGLYNEGGGNHCTYLSGALQMYLPGVASSLYRAFRAAYIFMDWEDAGYSRPGELGLRTSEFLEYKNTGRLGDHSDSGSIMTMSIAMSDEDDFEGGYFRLGSSQALFKVPRLSGIVFLSETPHAITQIMGGERKVFVNEIWEEADVPMGQPRPSFEQFADFQEDHSHDEL